MLLTRLPCFVATVLSLLSISLWAVAQTGATAPQVRPTTSPFGTPNSRASGPCAPVPPGLVGWWPGEDDVNDSTALNESVTPQGMRYAAGKVGRAFLVDVNRSVQVRDSDRLKLTQSLTIEAWVRVTLFPKGAVGQIFFRGDNRNGFDPYFLAITDGGQILFHVESQNARAELTAPVTRSQWVHIAATLDNGSGEMSLYTNGTLAARQITTVRPFGDLSQTFKPGVGIGNTQDASTFNQSFEGFVDELAVYNRALSLNEIQSIYNAGSAGKCRPDSSLTAASPPKPVASAAPFPAHNGALPIAPKATAATPPPVSTPSVFAPEQPVPGKSVVTLPALVEDAVVGHGGRFLILWLKPLQKLAVFDARAKRIIQYLPVPSDDVKFAASADKLVVALNDQNVMQRWSLRTFEKELTVPVPEGGLVRQIAMGYAGNGPLVVLNNSLHVYDVATLSRVEIESNLNRDVGAELRVSGDGSMFCGWTLNSSPGIITSLRISNRRAEAKREAVTPRYLIPNLDGSLFYCNGSIFNTDLKEISAGRFRDQNVMPIYGRGFFVAFADKGDNSNRLQNKLTPSIYSEVDMRRLITLPEMEELTWTGFLRSGFTFEKRVHVIPGEQLLVTIPDTKDRLVLRRFDLVEELNKAGLDYLFVDSHPGHTAEIGRKYTHQIDVESKRGGVQLSLDSGAPGMTLSKSGKLEWTVPANYTGKEENIIISIRDASGQEIYHTFKIAVQPPGQARSTPAAPVRPAPTPSLPFREPPVTRPAPTTKPLPTKPAPTVVSPTTALPPTSNEDGQNVEVVSLPALLEDVVAGSGGRHLILWLKKVQKLAIFDTREKRIVRYLSIPSDDVKFAAGADKLIVVLNDQSIMQRYDLRTFERELTVPAPEGGPVHSMAIGYASNGPLLIVNGPIGFYDPHTLKRLDIKFRPDLVMGWNSNARNPIQLRASGDGTTFTAWHAERGSHGFSTLRINGRTAEDGALRSEAAYVAPNFDGTMFYHHPLNAQLKEVAPGRFGEINFVPVYGGGFFLAIADKGSGRDRSQNKLMASIYSETDIKHLVTLPEMEEMTWPGYPRSGMTLDKRIYAMPDAQLMITIPDTKDRLVLRRFDLMEELNKAGIDYLYVHSRPARMATRGQKYTYQMDVRSKRGNVQYSLESGAPGMTLSKTGRLEWMVPADYAGKEESIIISIRDASGQEIYHTFKIAVQPVAATNSEMLAATPG